MSTETVLIYTRTAEALRQASEESGLPVEDLIAYYVDRGTQASGAAKIVEDFGLADPFKDLNMAEELASLGTGLGKATRFLGKIASGKSWADALAATPCSSTTPYLWRGRCPRFGELWDLAKARGRKIKALRAVNK